MKVRIIEKAPSADVYNYPLNKYVASLFGEVNELKLSQLIAVDGEDETILLYPHQLKVVDNGVLKAVVKQSFFKGSRYLIKAVFDRRVIFFEHDSELELNQEVSLMIA